MTKKRAKALANENFSNGLYCAESVVLSVARTHGIQSSLLPKAATAFCSGMARSCGTCGALTGAVLGVSAVLGRDKPGDSVDLAYTATADVINNFEDEFGSRNCQELLGCDLGTAEGQAMFREQQLGQRCRKYTAHAADLAEQSLQRAILGDVCTDAPLNALCDLLSRCGLPTDDVERDSEIQFYTVQVDGQLKAMIGLEAFGDVGLLRSLAVHPDLRGQHVGSALVNHLESDVDARGIKTLYLLTTNADQYFEALGYESIDRSTVPTSIGATRQFSDICPSDAVVMIKHLT